MLCSKCKTDKSLDKFYSYKSGRNKGYVPPYCKSCWVSYVDKKRQTFKGRFAELKRNAKQNDKQWDLSEDQVRPLWKKSCSYCGREMSLMSFDRVDNSKKYELDNIVSCCRWCNYTKGTGSPLFFYQQCLRVVNNMPEHLKVGDKNDGGDRYRDQNKYLEK